MEREKVCVCTTTYFFKYKIRKENIGKTTFIFVDKAINYKSRYK